MPGQMPDVAARANEGKTRLHVEGSGRNVQPGDRWQVPGNIATPDVEGGSHLLRLEVVRRTTEKRMPLAAVEGLAFMEKVAVGEPGNVMIESAEGDMKPS